MLAYPESVIDLMRKRKSWRTYREIPVAVGQKERINEFIRSLDPPPFGTAVRIALSDASLPGRKRMPGTYGVIKGARTLLIGAVTPSPMDMEDFGYAFEAVILCCTGLGLGTCWIGGTFDHDLFGGLIGLGPGETIPCVSPVGLMEDRRGLLDTIFALSAGSKNRKPFRERFFAGDFASPLDEGEAGPYGPVLEMARIAPSAMNKQPWRVVARDGCFHFFLERSPGYTRFTARADLQRVDMGIAMLHFGAAAAHYGLEGAFAKSDAARAIACPPAVEYRFSWVPAS
jgi:hypothetical protein